ncbi:MAG: PspC domain-containing protein [Chloroflexi bacterium]|nr:PspC domain-containing protein [Chloroflexota bacterium]
MSTENMTENWTDVKTAPEQQVKVENINNAETVTDAGTAGQTRTTIKRTLYRHPTDKLVGGVCGGLADYLGVDATLVRILWVVMTLVTSGGGFLAYLALWLLLPVGTVQAGEQRPAALELNERSLGRAAIVLMTLGGLWLLSNLGILPWLWGAFWGISRIFFWPALLIGAGYLLLRSTGQRDWNLNLGGMRDRWQSRTGAKMPSKEEVKDNLRQVKQRIPLKRSRRDRIFMGVCGGVGQRVGIDSNLIRLIWAAFSIGSIGAGVLVYIAVGLLLPEETLVDAAMQNTKLQDINVVDGTATHIV